MTAIFKRELKAYFTSPIGYIYLGITLLISGIFFVLMNLMSLSADMTPFFSNLQLIFVFLVPMLTMRLFAEEKRNKTDQLLLTSPVTVTKIVLGKYFSAVSMYGISLLITFIYPCVMLLYGKPYMLTIVALYLGFFLLGAALISIGVFISSSTESQVTAAIVTFVVMLLIMISGWIASIFNNAYVEKVIKWLSVMDRYQEFTSGILSLSAIAYFVSFISIFVYLTIQSIEKKRWS